LLVAGLDPANRRLRDAYSTVTYEYTLEASHAVPEAVLAREGAISPLDPRLFEVLDLLHAGRAAGLPHAGVNDRLQAWRATRGL